MSALLRAARSLLPGILLIAAAAAVLLATDVRSRRATEAVDEQRIAILQHSSSAVMDDIRDGVLAGLASRGWTPGPRLVIDEMNAQGDLPTGNAIAAKLASGGYRLVVTISTTMLQAFANANRDGRTTHVLVGVTAPVEAGVGIRALDSLDKPRWMTGIGSAQPVEAIFREAKRLHPELARVGTAWNAAEVNSEVCTRKARAISAELGITLLEAPVEGAKDVREAVGSVVARGAQAIWTGGDATVVPAIDALVAVAAKAGIPVFSNMGGQVKSGTLFDLGADYREVGAEAGRIAASILDGADPAAIPVRNFMPEQILLNEAALAGLRPPWSFDADIRGRASGVVVPGRALVLAATPTAPSPASAPGAPVDRPHRVNLLMYLESVPMEQGLAGIRRALAGEGLVEGRDLEMTVQSAQGDVAILNGIVDRVAGERPDLVVALSTPGLQAVVNKVRDRPIVFGVVSDPFGAGAGRSEAEHLANVTGVFSPGPFAEMARLLAKHFPRLRSVGTIFCPAETNSVASERLLRQALDRIGVTLESVPATTPGDLPDAAAAVASRPVDAIVQISDNQSHGGFSAIARAAARVRKPIFAFTSEAVAQGASVALAVDYDSIGEATGRMVARVLRGARPAEIPFERYERARLLVSEANARAVGFALPPALVAEAAGGAPGEAR